MLIKLVSLQAAKLGIIFYYHTIGWDCNSLGKHFIIMKESWNRSLKRKKPCSRRDSNPWLQDWSAIIKTAMLQLLHRQKALIKRQYWRADGPLRFLKHLLRGALEWQQVSKWWLAKLLKRRCTKLFCFDFDPLSAATFLKPRSRKLNNNNSKFKQKRKTQFLTIQEGPGPDWSQLKECIGLRWTIGWTTKVVFSDSLSTKI